MKTTGSILAGLLAAGLLAGCGGGGDAPHKAPVGSPGNPVPAKPQAETSAGSEGAAAVKPGYAKLLQKQTSKPASRFTPCNLVTKAQAGKILRTTVDQPVEAPMGPTCVYRSHDGRSFVTLAIKSQSFTRAARLVTGAAPLRVANHRAVCGKAGGPVLYVSLAHGQMLSVAGPCVAAQKFAEKAVGRLAE
jgi:hypothetical protein